jgi:hypothetical protein
MPLVAPVIKTTLSFIISLHSACYVFGEAAQRLALAACGRAWTMLEMWKKPEARKMPENAADSHTSAARCVGRWMNTRLAS